MRIEKQMGYKAAQNGYKLSENPFNDGDSNEKKNAWVNGYLRYSNTVDKYHAR